MLLGQGRNPRYYVLYPDGKRSCRMTKATAQDYQTLYGGEVKKEPSKHSWQSIKDWLRCWWRD